MQYIIDERFTFIEVELSIKIESLKNELDNLDFIVKKSFKKTLRKRFLLNKYSKFSKCLNNRSFNDDQNDELDCINNKIKSIEKFIRNYKVLFKQMNTSNTKLKYYLTFIDLPNIERITTEDVGFIEAGDFKPNESFALYNISKKNLIFFNFG